MQLYQYQTRWPFSRQYWLIAVGFFPMQLIIFLVMGFWFCFIIRGFNRFAEISCISSQQTLPLSTQSGVSSSGGRSRQSRHSPPPLGRPRSCAMADSADSDSSASRANANYGSRSTYHLHSQKQGRNRMHSIVKSLLEFVDRELGGKPIQK